MSKFNHYAKEAEKVAKQAISKYDAAESNLVNAKKKMDESPVHRNTFDPIYQAKARVIENEWQLARAEFDALRNRLPDEVKTELNAIRRELDADLRKSFAASPDQVDAGALEILKSGILTPDEYVHMIDEAAAKENFTMTRLIGKYAGDALEAEVKRNGNSHEASKLRFAIARSRESGADGYLDAFDTIAYTARRCIENPGMQVYWDQVVGKAIENF